MSTRDINHNFTICLNAICAYINNSTSAITLWQTWGNRQYELTNHLGNVIATITDRRLQVPGSNNTFHLEADVTNAQAYYAFGATMPGLQYTAANGINSYRYSFNGKEDDADITNGGQDYGMRIYDKRVARFLSVDPITAKYPELTPYQFASNTPIQAIDLDGGEAKNMITGETMLSPTEAQLKKQTSNDVRFWQDQFQFEKSYPFKYLIDQNPNINRQEMAKAAGDDVNMDYWEVKGTLPPNWTAKSLLNHIRKNLNDFMNHEVSTVGPINPAMKKLWESNNPTGAVMAFYPYAKDNSDVIVSQIGSDYWVFTPIWTTNDWRHPLAGHRQFGLTDNKDGTFTFYTRAIDRMWTPQDAFYNYTGLNPISFLSRPTKNVNKFFNVDAARTWGGLMDNVTKFIRSLGGTADRTSSFNKQVPWKKVVSN